MSKPAMTIATAILLFPSSLLKSKGTNYFTNDKIYYKVEFSDILMLEN